MLQLLKDSRLTNLFRRFMRWLYSLLHYAFFHPLKTLLFIIKAYLLLMLFAFFLTFSLSAVAQETTTPQDYECLNGGTLYDMNGTMICYVGAQAGELYRFDYGAKQSSHSAACDSAAAGYANGYTSTATVHYSNGGGALTYFSDPTKPSCKMTVNISVLVNDGTGQNWAQTTSNNVDNTIEVFPDQNFCPPQNAPEFITLGEISNVKVCYHFATPPPCDCSDLNGESSFTYQSLLAPTGVYSQENPPQCISVRDVDSPALACKCQILATKWFSQIANVNGVEYERWQPLPSTEQNGQSGIFTGTSCGTDEDTAPPPEKENCVVMKNGQKMCLAEKKNKCIVLDGIEQCEAGCGTKNGEFICLEDDNPPVDPNEPLPEPEDDISEPEKTTDQMTKQDFKDVNVGIETRLDLLAKLLEQNNSRVVGAGNANTGKLDSTNRLLGEINEKLGDLVEQGGTGDGSGDGTDDGTGDANPQPDYPTEAFEEFVSPNDWESKNFGTVIAAAVERMQQAPVFTAVEAFFQVSISGTCPTWQTSVGMPFGGSLDVNIDQLCSPAMEQVWPMIRAIVLLIFSFLAFRVAIL